MSVLGTNDFFFWGISPTSSGPPGLILIGVRVGFIVTALWLGGEVCTQAIVEVCPVVADEGDAPDGTDPPIASGDI